MIKSNALRDALQSAFPADTPTPTGAFPSAGDLVVTIDSKVTSFTNVHGHATACLTATWSDPFRTQVLSRSESEFCREASEENANLAEKKVIGELGTAIPTIAPKFRVKYREFADNLVTCHVSADVPLTNVALVVGDKRIGLADGDNLDVHCLPESGVRLEYRLEDKDDKKDLSRASCARPIVLVAERPRDTTISIAAGSGSGSGRNDDDRHGGTSTMSLTWYAVITSTVFLGSILVVILRNLFNPTSMNKDAMRILRIVLALFAGGFAASLTGFLTVHLESKTIGYTIDAGAGFAFAIIVFFFNPGTLGTHPDRPQDPVGGGGNGGGGGSGSGSGSGGTGG